MKKLFAALFILFLVLVFFRMSWFVLNGEVNFSSDIARDFHLMREIDQKKIVLIGPRSSSGLFHGPLWLYLNYPAFVAGQGNPVIVGWWWVFLMLFWQVSSFYVANKLFGKTVAYFFTAYIAIYSVFHVNGMYNPHGAMILMP